MKSIFYVDIAPLQKDFTSQRMSDYELKQYKRNNLFNQYVLNLNNKHAYKFSKQLKRSLENNIINLIEYIHMKYFLWLTTLENNNVIEINKPNHERIVLKNKNDLQNYFRQNRSNIV